MISVKSQLERFPVKASAPCRIDSGGTWDIKSMALPFELIRPATINAALSLRTSVTLSPYKNGFIRISSEGFTHREECPADKLQLNSVFGIFFAAVSYFGFHGLEIRISSQAPVKSALGGSSTALVALVKALTALSSTLGGKHLSKKDILLLAYHLEDAVSGGSCGLQDHAAAVYGGVNYFIWSYGNRKSPFQRYSILDRNGQKDFSRRLLVAYSGKSHVSSRTNRKWINDFISGKTRKGWMKVNEIVHELADAIKKHDWKLSVDLLQQEMAYRRQITPEAMIPVTAVLLDQAEQAGCGARFAGAGAGGSFWALGEKDNIDSLRNIWAKTLEGVKGGEVLNTSVDPEGAR
ncbi:MAG: galactokinase [Deltaproteobacteria bacterium]|nr:galactokinase [Deltaproteobacteria bacterium]